MTVDRHCGGNTTFEQVPQAQIFPLKRLDITAARDVEEFDWHVLLSQAEGALCAKMVEEDGHELQQALNIFSEAGTHGKCKANLINDHKYYRL